MHKMTAAVLATGLVMMGSVLARGPIEPVLVGGDGMDACASQGEVRGLNPNGDNFLAVRDGPGTNFAKIDELHTGDVVNLCDQFEGWYGIVYGRNCGVGTPINPRGAYSGPCASGWVSMRYVTVTAG